MSGKPFDNSVVVPLQRPAAADPNAISTYWQLAQRYTAQLAFAGRTSIGVDTTQPRSGFLHDAYKVRPLSPAQLRVALTAGLAYQYQPADLAGTLSAPGLGPVDSMGDLSGYKPLVLSEDLEINIPTPLPAAGQARYDILEVRYRRDFTDQSPALRFVPATNAFLPQVLPQTLTYSMGAVDVGYVTTPGASSLPIGYKQGAPAATGSQVEPPVTPGYVKIARILVENGATAITGQQIQDTRMFLAPEGVVRVSGTISVRTTGPQPLPQLVELNAPAGVRVVAFCRTVGAGPQALVFTGQPVRSAAGHCYVLSQPFDPLAAPSNNAPIVFAAPGAVSAFRNRIVQVVDIDPFELANPNLTNPAGDFSFGEVFSSVGGVAFAWDPVAKNFAGALPDPFYFAFQLEFSY